MSRPQFRCIQDDPAGVAIEGNHYYTPVCPTHGTKACVVKRYVHHREGCRQARHCSVSGRRSYLVDDPSRVTCHNCRAKLRRLGLLTAPDPPGWDGGHKIHEEG